MNPAAKARWWSASLAAAFRTALACSIVGCTTLYGPASFQSQIAFPAFSYVTAILIVTDATLGDTLRGCWCAVYATVQSIGPAMLSLWIIGPARLSSVTTALAVALGAFVVALPESTHLTAKRIALGQIVIVYVLAFIHGEHTESVMHSVHVAASTAVGVFASVLALLIPYPRLAHYEVKQNCKLLAENVTERLKLSIEAFSAEDNTSAPASISQVKSFAGTGTKLLQSIKRYQESMQWERLQIKIFKPSYINLGYRLQEIEIPFRGMEMALTSTSSFPVQILDGELKDGLLRLQEHLIPAIEQAKSCLPYNSLTVPEPNAEDITKSLKSLQIIPTTHKDLPSIFFLFCMKFLHRKLLTTPSASKQDNIAVPENQSSTDKPKGFSIKWIWSYIPMKVSSKRLMPAFKCSLSLGLAVLLGLTYSKENGFWAGLPVATSLASTREATFRVANVKAQGTVLGNVYGVLACFVFERYLPIRFLSLLPWFIITSFLQRSRMYGQAGGISAVIGAVLILGRKNFGPTSEFAIARITETFIGLSCSIMVELLLQPTRASTLAKIQLSKSLGTLQSCVGLVSLGGSCSTSELEENQKRLKMDIRELGNVISEADLEPSFWFLPFHSACYSKLLKSLSKMADLLFFSAHVVGLLRQESSLGVEASWKEIVNKLDDDLELFNEVVCSSIKCFQKVTLLKSLSLLEKELAKSNVSCDLELGKSQNPNISMVSDEHEMEKFIDSYLQHSKEIVDKIHVEGEEEEEVKCQMVLGLSALGFCISSLVRETSEIEKEVKELVQWENPSSHIDLYEISCKMHALYK